MPLANLCRVYLRMKSPTLFLLAFFLVHSRIGISSKRFLLPAFLMRDLRIKKPCNTSKDLAFASFRLIFLDVYHFGTQE